MMRRKYMNGDRVKIKEVWRVCSGEVGIVRSMTGTRANDVMYLVDFGKYIPGDTHDAHGFLPQRTGRWFRSSDMTLVLSSLKNEGVVDDA